MKRIALPFFIAAEGFESFGDAAKSLWSEIWPIVLSIGTTLLIIYGIAVAVTWISAGGDEQKRRAAKTKIIYYTTGIVLAFVVLVGVPMIITGMSDWAGDYGGI